LIERGNLQIENGSHASRVELASSFHQFAAPADESNSIGKREHTGGGYGR
jgi:hypothetical protein